MTPNELDLLRESHSFPPSIRIRILEEDETMASTHPGEVFFYEAAFHAGLLLPLRSVIRRIFYFYNICPTQLVPNTWQSLVYAVVMWRAHKLSLSLNEFQSLFTLNKNPKPDSRWLYFKVRAKKKLLGGYPQNVKRWKKKFFFISGDDWELPSGTSGDVRVPRVLSS